MEQSHAKQKLLDIKRTTKITTEDIAKQAQLRVSDVFMVEVGGYATWETALKVVTAFNQLSGSHIKVDEIKFSPMYAFNSFSGNTVSPQKPARHSLL
jgi:hypothetical protein